MSERTAIRTAERVAGRSAARGAPSRAGCSGAVCAVGSANAGVGRRTLERTTTRRWSSSPGRPTRTTRSMAPRERGQEALARRPACVCQVRSVGSGPFAADAGRRLAARPRRRAPGDQPTPGRSSGSASSTSSGELIRTARAVTRSYRPRWRRSRATASASARRRLRGTGHRRPGAQRRRERHHRRPAGSAPSWPPSRPASDGRQGAPRPAGRPGGPRRCPGRGGLDDGQARLPRWRATAVSESATCSSCDGLGSRMAVRLISHVPGRAAVGRASMPACTAGLESGASGPARRARGRLWKRWLGSAEGRRCSSATAPRPAPPVAGPGDAVRRHTVGSDAARRRVQTCDEGGRAAAGGSSSCTWTRAAFSTALGRGEVRCTIDLSSLPLPVWSRPGLPDAARALVTLLGPGVSVPAPSVPAESPARCASAVNGVIHELLHEGANRG